MSSNEIILKAILTELAQEGIISPDMAEQAYIEYFEYCDTIPEAILIVA